MGLHFNLFGVTWSRWRFGVRYKDGKFFFYPVTSNPGAVSDVPAFSVDVREVVAICGAFLLAGLFILKEQYSQAEALGLTAISYAFGRVTTSRQNSKE